MPLQFAVLSGLSNGISLLNLLAPLLLSRSNNFLGDALYVPCARLIDSKLLERYGSGRQHKKIPLSAEKVYNRYSDLQTF